MNTGSSTHAAAPLRAGRSTVLIVDDEPDIRDGLSEIVAGLGLPVLSAYDCNSAKAVFTAHRNAIDLVITDLKMDQRSVPSSAGGELIDWLSEQDARCQIIVYTGFGSFADMQDKVRKRQVVSYLEKTGDPDVIERHVLAARSNSEFGILKVKEYQEWTKVSDSGIDAPRWEIIEDFALDASTPAHARHLGGVLGFTLGAIRRRSVATDKGAYVEIIGDGLRVLRAPGAPALPFSIRRVALPGPLYETAVQIEDPEWVPLVPEVRAEAVLPVPEPRLDEGSPVSYVQRNTYDADDQLLVPSASRNLDGVACLTLGLRPFRFDPVTGYLQVLKSARLRIAGRSGTGVDAPGEIDPFSPLAQQVLGWPGGAVSGTACTDAGRQPGNSGRPLPSGSGRSVGGANGGLRRYLAVGTLESLAAVEPLLQRYRHAPEFEVLPSIVIGADDVRPAANAAPQEVAMLIRAALQERCDREAHKPHFVLLAGGGETVPFHRYDRYRSEHDYPLVEGIPILSDLWYALFDRDGGASRPRFAVGRLPFDDVVKLEACAKGIAREGSARTWSHWLFMCSKEPSNGGPLWYQRNIGDAISAVPPDHPLIQAHQRGPAFHPHPPTVADIALYVGRGPTLVTFRGHGRRHGWELEKQHKADTVLSIWPPSGAPLSALSAASGVFSVACCTAAPDEPHAGCGDCKVKDGPIPNGCTQIGALGPRIVEECGVPWFLGSSRPSFADVNDEVHIALMLAVCGDPNVDGFRGFQYIGDAHRYAIEKILEVNVLPGIPGVTRDMRADTAAMSILIGDPAARICATP